jgi:hypothetical protein
MKTFIQYLEGLGDRYFSVDNPDNYKNVKDWGMNPKLAYRNSRQAKEMENKARGRAELLNRQSNDMVRMYKTININDLEKKLNNIMNSGQTSVSVGHKAKGVWNTDLVLSGLGRIEYYYAKDVSTNDIGDGSGEMVPLTPLNRERSDYDEALAIGKNVKWDKIFYNPEVVKTFPDFFEIVKRHGIEAISTDSSNLPAPISYTKNLEKTKKKLILNTDPS